MAKILIAGGGGFIGTHLREALPSDRYIVNYFGREGWKQQEKSPDWLIWLAGNRQGSQEELTKVHVYEPQLAVKELDPHRILYVSTGEIYGQGKVPFRETQNPTPLTPYGKAKLQGERELEKLCLQSGKLWACIRPGVVYGFGQSSDMLIPSALAALKAGINFPTTLGQQTRDFVDIRDAIAAMLLVIEQDISGTWNVGSGVEMTVHDLLLQLAASIGEGADKLLQFGSIPQRQGEADRYFLDTKHATNTLGFKPKFSPAEGLEYLIQMS